MTCARVSLDIDQRLDVLVVRGVYAHQVLFEYADPIVRQLVDVARQ